MVDESQSSTIAFMREIFAYLGSSKSTFNLLNSIHQSLQTVLYAENFYVVLMTGAQRFVTFPYYRDVMDNISIDELNLVSIDQLVKTLTSYAIQKKKVVCLTRPEIEALALAGEVDVLGTMPEQWLCFPLHHQGAFLGDFVVQSYRSQNEYSQHDIDILILISHVIAAALFLFKRNSQISDTLNEIQLHKDRLEEKIHERTYKLEQALNDLQKEMAKGKKLEQKLKFIAFHDNLTNLYNRQYFLDQMKLLTSKSHREETHVIIAFLDLDGFKKINDENGHACGDHVLQITAQRLKKCFRQHDIIARYGGDEFVVLLNNQILLEDLKGLLHRVITVISSDISYQEQEVSVGLSIGLSQSKQATIDTQKLLEQADQALYQAKANGKGCFVFN
ncbi:sensor domain-containing diguanylate cyclase [Colwellia psychrerythraea]|uniref:Diguanylate cyclase n=1 Tax=Colwellia psychrerythraea TaxID=28229 RepID=A0A099KMH7_COLPS|nr:sensor domain-containing diguanylate cyclase [Colwellia psychrerythraea]KGJ91646.1 diguanylate cyclase [Colwellia psychrerythraea]